MVGQDHWTQASGSSHGEGKNIVDLWDGHAPSNLSGTFSAKLYSLRAVEIVNAAAAAGERLFLYLAWHNTHFPIQCPPEWMYASMAAYNNSEPARMTYNCMARILDDGVGNVTKALKAGGLWNETLIMFVSHPAVFSAAPCTDRRTPPMCSQSADNGGTPTYHGWPEGGSNNWPLRGKPSRSYFFCALHPNR